MKKSSHDITEPSEKQHYKKKYLVRKFQEQEAEHEIKEFTMEENEQRYDDRLGSRTSRG